MDVVKVESLLKIVFNDGGYTWKRISKGRDLGSLYNNLLKIGAFRYAKLYEMIGKKRGKKNTGYVGSQYYFFNRMKRGPA